MIEQLTLGNWHDKEALNTQHPIPKTDKRVVLPEVGCCAYRPKES